MDALFKQGIEYFNSEYFFEAHDAFEEIWMDIRGNDRRFFQGLVQVSTGFYHLRMRNLDGGVSQLAKGVEKLNAFLPTHHNVDLDRLLTEVKACINMLKSVTIKDFAFSGMRSTIPKIRTIEPH